MAKFEPQRIHKNHPFSCTKLKAEEDEFIAAYLKKNQPGLDVFLIAHQKMGLCYPLTSTPVVGVKAVGAESMSLEDGDRTVNRLLVLADEDMLITIVTQRGAVKRMLTQEISQASRAKRGVTVMRGLKKNPHHIIYTSEGRSKEITLMSQKEQQITIDPTDFSIGDRTSNDSFAMDEKKGGEATEAIGAPEIFIKS